MIGKKVQIMVQQRLHWAVGEYTCLVHCLVLWRVIWPVDCLVPVWMFIFSAEKDTAGVGTGMERVDEGNTDHPPGLSLNGDNLHKQQPKKESRGRFSVR